MKNVRKILIIVLFVTITIPFFFYNGQAATLPSKYKLTDHITITPKDQGWYNDGYMLCWAFSSLSALETHIQLKSNGNENPYLSVRHLDYLSSSYCENNTGIHRNICDVGGSFYALKYFMNNYGPVSNNKSNLTRYPTWNSQGVVDANNYINMALRPAQIQELSEYTPEYYVHKIVSFPSIRKNNGVGTYVTIDSAYEQIATGNRLTESELTANRDKIKQHIMENGGVTCLVNPYTRKYDSNGIAYLYGATSSGGHMVTIVGWNDDLDISAKTNGQLNPLDKGAKGAYLVLNSYGNHYGGNTPNDGLEWVSYYDADVELCNFGYLEVDKTKNEISARFSNTDLYNTIKNKMYTGIENSTIAQCAYKGVDSRFYPINADETNKKLTMLDLVANTYSITNIDLTNKGVTANDIVELAKIAPDLSDITLDNNELTNINGISNISNLTKLKANNNKIDSIVGVKNIINQCAEVELKNQSLNKTISNTNICTYPNIFTEAKYLNSKIYSESGLEFVNCTENSDGKGIKVTDVNKVATVTIKSGNAQGSTLTINVIKKGDVTGDGNINIRDIIKIRKYIANSTKWNLTDNEKTRADVDENNKINIRDIIKIRKYIAASSSETIRRKHPDWVW